MAAPKLDITLVQTPAAPATLTPGQVVTYTMTIQPDAASGATAAQVAANVALAGLTITTGSIVVNDPSGTDTVTTSANGFNLAVTAPQPTNAKPITVTFSATVNALANGTSVTAGTTLTYKDATAPTDEIVYGTQRYAANPQFYKYDVNTKTLTNVYTPTSDQDSLVFDNAGTGGGIIFSGSGETGTNAGAGIYIERYDIATGTTKQIFGGSGNEVYDLTLSPDGKTVYFGDLLSSGYGQLYKIDISNSDPTTWQAVRLTTTANGTNNEYGQEGVTGLAFDGTGRLFGNLGTTNGYNGGNKIVQLDPATGKILKTSAVIHSGITLDGMCYDSFTGDIFTVSATDGTGGVPNLYEIDPNTLTVVKSWSITGHGNPDGFQSDGLGKLWIAGYHNSIIEFDIATGTVSQSVSTPLIDDVVPVTGSGAIGTYSAFASASDTVGCYAEGTNIRTSRGDVAVEDLRAGDVLVTVSGNGTELKPVKWIGHRRVDCARHPRQHDVWPVRISAGAFGGGLPERDLLLSPDHSVFMDGALIPVRYLLNGATVTEMPVAAVTYFHVELPAHDVILAEGLPCESYLDTGNRSAFANGDGPTAVHPDFALRVWGAQACAPLVYEGPALEAARSWLLDRAEALGHRVTSAPALRLCTDAGMATAETDGVRLRFHLPAGARSLWLESRISVPAHMNPESIDCRQLGVAIGALALDGVAVPLTDARLGDGWHAAEPGLRWTDGRASIAVDGARVLEVDVAMTAIYWDDDAAERLSRAA